MTRRVRWVVFILFSTQLPNWKQPDSSTRNLTLMASMDDFHCDTFEMRIQFDPHELHVDEFLKALSEQGISTEEDDDGDIDTFTVFTGEANYHAHLTVNISKDRSGRLELNYYSFFEEGPEASVNVDNCANWLGGFFDRSVSVHFHVNYTFRKPFRPVINLPFPLVPVGKELAGTLVAGLALVLPNGTTAIIHGDPEESETHIFLRDTVQRDLKEFDLFGELEQLLPTISKLVKQNENAGVE